MTVGLDFISLVNVQLLKTSRRRFAFIVLEH